VEVREELGGDGLKLKQAAGDADPVGIAHALERRAAADRGGGRSRGRGGWRRTGVGRQDGGGKN
jgi:hypothetical protein